MNENILHISQIVLSVIVVVLILLQQRNAGTSGLLGGGGGDSVYQTRRGLERIVFYATIVCAIAFAALAAAQLFIAR